MAVETFGEKTAWLAFKTGDFNRVRVLLFGADADRDVAWDDGVHASYEWTDVNTANVFVTPPIEPKRRRGAVRGTFILATGTGLLRWWIHGHSYAELNGLACPPLMHNELVTRAAAWSRDWQLEIQCFANQRNIGLYGWARVRPDATVRRFSKLDNDLLEHEGELTDEERALAAAVPVPERDELCERVPTSVAADEVAIVAALLNVAVGPDDVAARWSLYPDTLERLPMHGWLGALRL